ncbi:MAG: YlbF family regulator [Bacilli bacterium]
MNNIKKEIDELFNSFEASKSYKEYLQIKIKLETNTRIKKIIEEIRCLQKTIANLKDKDITLENDLIKLYLELESFPIYRTYLIKLDEINEDLFEVKETFNQYFEDILKL